jgi:hypothetical protein
MRRDNQKYHEVLELIAGFHTQNSAAEKKYRHYVPFSENPRFWGREDILARIDDALLLTRRREP